MYKSGSDHAVPVSYMGTVYGKWPFVHNGLSDLLNPAVNVQASSEHLTTRKRDVEGHTSVYDPGANMDMRKASDANSNHDNNDDDCISAACSPSTTDDVRKSFARSSQSDYVELDEEIFLKISSTPPLTFSSSSLSGSHHCENGSVDPTATVGIETVAVNTDCLPQGNTLQTECVEYSVSEQKRAPVSICDSDGFSTAQSDIDDDTDEIILLEVDICTDFTETFANCVTDTLIKDIDCSHDKFDSHRKVTGADETVTCIEKSDYDKLGKAEKYTEFTSDVNDENDGLVANKPTSNVDTFFSLSTTACFSASNNDLLAKTCNDTIAMKADCSVTEKHLHSEETPETSTCIHKNSNYIFAEFLKDDAVSTVAVSSENDELIATIPASVTETVEATDCMQIDHIVLTKAHENALAVRAINSEGNRVVVEKQASDSIEEHVDQSANRAFLCESDPDVNEVNSRPTVDNDHEQIVIGSAALYSVRCPPDCEETGDEISAGGRKRGRLPSGEGGTLCSESPLKKGCYEQALENDSSCTVCASPAACRVESGFVIERDSLDDLKTPNNDYLSAVRNLEKETKSASQRLGLRQHSRTVRAAHNQKWLTRWRTVSNCASTRRQRDIRDKLDDSCTRASEAVASCGEKHRLRSSSVLTSPSPECGADNWKKSVYRSEDLNNNISTSAAATEVRRLRSNSVTPSPSFTLRTDHRKMLAGAGNRKRLLRPRAASTDSVTVRRSNSRRSEHDICSSASAAVASCNRRKPLKSSNSKVLHRMGRQHSGNTAAIVV